MRIVAGFLIGLVLGGALTLGLGILWLSYGEIAQREGGAAMGVIFFITPAGALLGGIAGAVTGVLRRRR